MQSQPSSIGIDFTQIQYELFLTQCMDLEIGPFSLPLNDQWREAQLEDGTMPLDVDQQVYKAKELLSQ